MNPYICTTDEDIRDCPNLNADKKHCDTKETKCVYRMDEKGNLYEANKMV